MNVVAPVHVPVSSAPKAEVVVHVSHPVPLLPEAEEVNRVQLQDAMSQLYALLARLRDLQSEQGVTDIKRAVAERKIQETKEDEALAQAKEAAEDDGFFSSTFFKVAVLVVAVAASVVTCGTAAGLCVAVAAIALSAAGGEVAKSGTFDDVFGKGSSQWIGLGMQVVGAVGSCGAGMIGSGSQVLQSAGVAASTAEKVKSGATLVSAGTQVAKGAAQMSDAVRQNDVDVANIDAMTARKQALRLQRFVEMLVFGLKESKESFQRAAESLHGAIETSNQTLSIVANATKV